jgi:hypothetical protein
MDDATTVDNGGKDITAADAVRTSRPVFGVASNQLITCLATALSNKVTQKGDYKLITE